MTKVHFHQRQNTMREVSVTLRSSRNHISGTNCYGVRKDIVINGEKFSLYVYLNTKSASEEESTLYSHIDRLEDELKEMKKPMSMSRYSKYYKIKTKKEVQLESFERDHEKITDILSMLGVFAFLSNHSTMTPQEALHIYSRRDFIEKAFDNLKNELDNDRMLTHNEKTTDGKSFVSFLSLIMWSDLQRTINNNNKKVEKTIQRVLETLKMIRRIDNENLSMLLQPLTKKQKDILEALEIDQKIFVDKILNTKV
ncbi:MAG: IS1634 family transposase [Bdellovibrionota bacterium]